MPNSCCRQTMSTLLMLRKSAARTYDDKSCSSISKWTTAGYSYPPLMSLTETEKHWLWGCAFATAASKSDVNVAIPHLRGKWSPTKAILRTLQFSFMSITLAHAVGTSFDQSDPLGCSEVGK